MNKKLALWGGKPVGPHETDKDLPFEKPAGDLFRPVTYADEDKVRLGRHVLEAHGFKLGVIKTSRLARLS